MSAIAVILPAAGLGIRFGGGLPKQFTDLAGVSILQRTLRFFVGCPEVSEILVAAPPGQVASVRRRIAGQCGKSAIRIVKGGTTRQESVRRALHRVPRECEWVAVHDVVRPLLDRGLFAALLRAAQETGAAIPGLPVTNTLKRIDENGLVIETIPRDSFVEVQTPQVFRRELLVKAMQRACEEKFVGTDEAMLVERLGVSVRVVPGLRRNIKITVPGDLQMAEWLLGDGERLKE